MSIHAIKRAKERYGLELTFDDLNWILNEIKEGRAKGIKYENIFDYDNGGEHYRLRFKKKLIEPVVKYDSNCPFIVTFWPTGKKFQKRWKQWLQRFKDENFKHLCRKGGKGWKQ